MSEAYGPDFITVTDEDGNEFELELVDTLEHNGVTYHALFPASQEDEESGEPVDVDADDEEYGPGDHEGSGGERRGAALHPGQRRGDRGDLQPLHGAVFPGGGRITQTSGGFSCSVRDGPF